MRFFRRPSSAKRPVGNTDASVDGLGTQPISQGPMEQGTQGVLGRSRTFLAVTALSLSVVTGAHAQQGGMGPALTYDAQTRGPVPIPSSERGLQTIVAEPWFKVSDEGLVLEGPAFDRAGNLLFCDVSGRRVLRLTPDKRLATVVSLDQLGPGGLAVHKDGRVFIAAMDLANGVGSILAVEPDGSGMRTIVPPEVGYMPNDLVFDAQGGLYFTDFRGASTDPKGGVYYVSPDFRTITPVLPHLAMANGVALSPDGKELWGTEFSRNLLHRVELAGPTTIARFGTAVAYHFTGPAPDSMRADSTPPEVMNFGAAWPAANFELIDKTTEIAPGMTLLALISDAPGTKELKELSLALNTPQGMVVIVGCSHPGIDKIVEAAAAINPKIHLIAGGFHLVVASDEIIAKTVVTLKEVYKVSNIAPGHCTGEPMFAALQKAFGPNYIYAGLGTSLQIDSLATNQRRGEGPALDDSDAATYRRLARREDPLGTYAWRLQRLDVSQKSAQ
jgi:lactonase